jgi:hypothetical protein
VQQAANEPATEGNRPPRGRIFLNAGEVDGADEAKIRETFASLAAGIELQRAEVRRTHAFLDVRPEDLEAAVAALNGKEAFGKTLSAEKARRRRR